MKTNHLMEQQRFTVKEFSKLVGVTPRTLKYYEEIGLFFPYMINEENNYRYYLKSQQNDIESIQILKQCGMKLKEIKEYIKKPSPSRRYELLTLQWETLQEQIQKKQQICDIIALEQSMLDDCKKYPLNELHSITLPMRDYVLHPVKKTSSITIQTFCNHSLNGVYYKKDKLYEPAGLFHMNVSADKGVRSFSKQEFLIYYYEDHPGHVEKHFKKIEESCFALEISVESPLFCSALYEDSKEHYISFIMFQK